MVIIICKDNLNASSGSMVVLGKNFIYTSGYSGSKDTCNIINLEKGIISNTISLNGIYFGNDMVSDESTSRVYITPGPGENRVAVVTINSESDINSDGNNSILVQYILLPQKCSFSSTACMHNGILFVCIDKTIYYLRENSFIVYNELNFIPEVSLLKEGIWYVTTSNYTIINDIRSICAVDLKHNASPNFFIVSIYIFSSGNKIIKIE